MQYVREASHSLKGRNKEEYHEILSCILYFINSLSDFYTNFKSVVEAYEHYGGIIGHEPALIKHEEDTNDLEHPGPMPEEVVLKLTQDDGTVTTTRLDSIRAWLSTKQKYDKKIRQITRDRALAVMFLEKVDKKKYTSLLNDLHNQHTRGTTQYPKTLSEAYTMVYKHKYEQGPSGGDKRNNGQHNNDHYDN